MENKLEGKEFVLEQENVTLDERFSQIRKILRAAEILDEVDPDGDLDDIFELWFDHLKTALPPLPWTALWEPSRSSRTTPDNSTMSTESRTVNHFVDVVKLNWTEFTADVEVLGMDVLKQNVPLSELHGPIRVSEDDDQYDLPTAKRALNNLHFFLSYLWFPWDEASEEDDGDKTGWVEQHLENRLEIVRSFLENGPSSDVFIRMGRLAREFSEAHSTVEAIREQYKSEETCHDEAANLIRLEKRLEEIESEANVLENPGLRAAFESMRTAEKQRQHGPCSLNCLVWPFGDFVELSSFLEKVKDLSAFDTSLTTVFASSLQDAIAKCLPDDRIFLPSGVHTFTDLGDLKDGVKIVGMNMEETVVEVEMKNLIDDFAMYIGGIGAEFENVSIRATSGNEGALLLRDGTTILNKVHISGFKVGIKVLPGAALVLANCEICDCSRGLDIEAGSCVQATDVDIIHNKVGIFVKDISGENIRFNRVVVNSEKDIVVLSEYNHGDDFKFLSKTIIEESTMSDPIAVSSLSE